MLNAVLLGVFGAEVAVVAAEAFRPPSAVQPVPAAAARSPAHARSRFAVVDPLDSATVPQGDIEVEAEGGCITLRVPPGKTAACGGQAFPGPCSAKIKLKRP